MSKTLLLLFFPILLSAQQNLYESEIFSMKSANANLYFDIDYTDLVLKEIKGKENKLVLRVKLKAISEETLSEVLEEERYLLLLENNHFKMSNFKANPQFQEQISLELAYTSLYKWDDELQCLSWKDKTLIARSGIEFHYQYIIELEKDSLPPASMSVPLPKD